MMLGEGAPAALLDYSRERLDWSVALARISRACLGGFPCITTS
jgi:hypothetical protein